VTTERDKQEARAIINKANRQRSGHFMGDCAGNGCPDWLQTQADAIVTALFTARAEVWEKAIAIVNDDRKLKLSAWEAKYKGCKNVIEALEAASKEEEGKHE
jgi:hypothetical protein